LWWSWDNDCVSFFRDLDPVRWRALNHNPISCSARCRWQEHRAACAEMVLHSRINYAYRRQREYLEADRTWGASPRGRLRPRPVAYFSAEFGLHESIADLFRRPGNPGRRSHQERIGPGYSTGRHRPVLWPGLLSGNGSMQAAGNWRNILTDVNQAAHGAGDRQKRRAGDGTRSIHRRGGFVREGVAPEGGRCDLLLLDSNVEGNAPEDRQLTSRLYGGDGRTRIRQELLLGVGGVRALEGHGHTPGVCT
jgi:starch phosphorylase